MNYFSDTCALKVFKKLARISIKVTANSVSASAIALLFIFEQKKILFLKILFLYHEFQKFETNFIKSVRTNKFYHQKPMNAWYSARFVVLLPLLLNLLSTKPDKISQHRNQRFFVNFLRLSP